jgi:surface polysaccharide O-acyltransferase-like enzyme
MAQNARNILIVLTIAALVVLIPGGGTGANVAIQAVSLTFLASAAWVASLMYREHRVALYSLGDVRRAILYVAVGVAALTLTATSRLWHTGAGEVAWIALLVASAYTVFSVIWSARRY